MPSQIYVPSLPVARGRLVAAGATHLTIPGVAITAQLTAALVANTVRYFPILVLSDCTIDQLLIAVTAASGGGTTARLGIYNASVDWVPGTLILDAGTVAVDGNGNKTIAISQALTPGRYYLALNSDSTPTIRLMRGSLAQPLILSTISGNALITALTAAQVYAVFPSPGTAIDTVTSSTTPFEYGIFCRLSAG